MSRGKTPLDPRRRSAEAALNHEVRGWQADQELFDSLVVELAGMNRSDWRALDLLGTRGAMSAGELADAMRLTTGAVTGLLDRLESVGLVQRARDTKDRRRVIVELTTKVDDLAAPVYGPLMTDAAAALAAFETDELELIARFIGIERDLLRKHTARLTAMRPRAAGSAD